MRRQVIFITDSLQYFHFYQLPTTAWDGMPAVSTVVRASHGHKLNWENCWRFYELMLRHLMAHFRAYLKISLKLLSVRSGTSHFLSSLLVSFGHRSAFLSHSFTGHSFCLTLPNTCLSASVWNSIFSDIDWIFMHIFFSRQVVSERPSHASLFNHVSIKNISTYFSGKALLSLFFKVMAAYCCVCFIV